MYKKGQLQEKGSTCGTSITSNFKRLTAKGYLFDLAMPRRTCFERLTSDSAIDSMHGIQYDGILH